MTANNTNSAGSENSVSPVEDRTVTLARDPELRRIVEHAANSGGATTRRDLAAKTGWPISEIDTHLELLEAGKYVELIGEAGHSIVVLTHRGEQLARGEL